MLVIEKKDNAMTKALLKHRAAVNIQDKVRQRAYCENMRFERIWICEECEGNVMCVGKWNVTQRPVIERGLRGSGSRSVVCSHVNGGDMLWADLVVIISSE